MGDDGLDQAGLTADNRVDWALGQHRRNADATTLKVFADALGVKELVAEDGALALDTADRARLYARFAIVPQRGTR